ncbi:hypothetical protein KUTeg_022413 [Tegillarca granosa]|uniref:Uncharacterized protein n=1 Tax=Tegillarca granosa TaxID=220873 RepID=A0ABQ9E6C2_TEGGR|nr:hypothetical protein KUTeg_022413 [Tegillarca granosa]
MKQVILWKHQLYSLILYRVLLSNYASEAVEDEKTLSQMDITCGILPDIGISLFVELIKDCDLSSLFISELQEIDTSVAFRLLRDCITHVSTDPVDCKDVQFALLMLDWVASRLLVTKGDNVSLSHSTNNKPSQIPDGQQYSTMTGSANFELISCIGTLLEFCNKEIENVIRVIEDSNFDQIVSWSRLNLFGYQVSPLSNFNIANKKEKLYGKLSSEGTNSKTLDVDCDCLHTLKTEFPWQHWKNCLMGLLDHKSHIFKELVKSENFLEKEIILCRSPFTLSTTKCCEPDHNILCNFSVLVNTFINCISEAKFSLKFSETEISKVLADTLKCNVDVFGFEEFLFPMYPLIKEIYDKGSTEELKQIILEGFSLLNIELKNKHISYVYKTFGCWPVSSEEKLAIDLFSDIFKLTLQNAPLVLNLSVHRMINSTQQAQIIAKICCSLHTVCRLEHSDYPGRSLLGVHHEESASVTSKTGEMISPLDITEFIQQTILPYLNVVNLYRSSQPIKTTVALEIAKYVLPLFMETDSLLANDNDIKKKLIGSISPIMICVGELFHECVVLWEDQESLYQQSKVHLLENLIQFVNYTEQISEEIGFKLSDSGIVGQIDNLDWTVGILPTFMKYIRPKEAGNYDKEVCQDFSSSLIKNGESEDFEDGLVSILRFVSINDELLDTTMKNIGEILQQEGDIFISYESLIFSLVQVLPNLLTQEWLRCVDFIQMLLQHEAVNIEVVFLASIGKNLQEAVCAIDYFCVFMFEEPDINISLQLSQCLHDFLMLLSQSTLQSNNSAVNHCVKNEERVLAKAENLQNGCAIYLLSEVFHHVCAATSWMSESSSESTSVVLLDLICMFQEINNKLSTKKQKTILKMQREAILNDSALYISDQTLLPILLCMNYIALVDWIEKDLFCKWKSLTLGNSWYHFISQKLCQRKCWLPRCVILLKIVVLLLNIQEEIPAAPVQQQDKAGIYTEEEAAAKKFALRKLKRYLDLNKG